MRPWEAPGFEDTDPVVEAFDDLPLWAAPFGLALLETVRLRDIVAALDVGCGAGFPLVELAERLGENVPTIGLDPWARAIRRAARKAAIRDARNVSLIRGVAEQMPFRDRSFDLIVSNNGMNNVADPERAFAECARVAKPGAQLVITANLPESFKEFYEPYEELLRERGLEARIARVRAQIDHKRKPIDFTRGLIERAGFSSVKVREERFTMRFADGRALFRHWVIRIAFLDGWAGILEPEERGPIFEALEERLGRGSEISLTVPFACIEANRTG